MGLTRAALAYEALAAPDREHLDSVRASWSMLADFCFSDLVLYLRDVPSDPDWDTAIDDRFGGAGHEMRFVMADHVRPTTGQTIYHEDITGAIRTAEQRPIVADAFASGRVVDGLVASAWLDEQVQVRCIPVRHDEQVIAVMARESALSLQRPPGALETAYLAVFDRFAAMMVAGTFPFADDEVEGLRYRPRVGDGVMVIDAHGVITYSSPNATSALTRSGVVGNVAGSRLADLALDVAWVVESLASGIPRAREVETHLAERDTSIVMRVLPLIDGIRPDGAVVLLRDVSDLRRRDRALVSKDATIREIHHRVKNNLQTISSLLRLQGRRLVEPSAKAAIEESVRRIRTIALVHEILSREPRDDVAFHEVVRPLVRMVEEGLVSPDRPLHVVVTGDPGDVPAPAATSLAVVLTELLQNIVDHAYPQESAASAVPTVGLDMHRQDDQLVLVVSDDGVGVPPGFDPATTGTLGLSIVMALVESELGGAIAYRSAQEGTGTVVTVTVPLAGEAVEGGPDATGP